MDIRNASAGDLAACVDMIEARRRQYEVYEPRFWKKAADSAASTHPWFLRAFEDDGTVSLVAAEGEVVVGFLIAGAIATPPVYDPGGPTALIDDFCVASAALWPTVGRALLVAGREALRGRGYAQIVVVCGDRDEAKKRLLADTDLSLASTWWTARV